MNDVFLTDIFTIPFDIIRVFTLFFTLQLQKLDYTIDLIISYLYL